MTAITTADPRVQGAWFLFGGFFGIPALMPSTVRRVRPVAPGDAGRKFLAGTSQSNDAYTFDLSLLLDAGTPAARTIEAVTTFTVTAADAASANADPSPGSRLTAGPVLDPTLTKVTVRIGAVPAGITANYRLWLTVRDSDGNVFDSFATAPFGPPGGVPWVQ